MKNYFTIEELCRSSEARTKGIDNTTADPAVVSALENLIRNCLNLVCEVWGEPIRVTGGYRCPELNRLMNGLSSSSHLNGEAAHFTAGDPDANRELFRLIQASGLEFDELAVLRSYQELHISYRRKNNRRIVRNLKK